MDWEFASSPCESITDDGNGGAIDEFDSTLSGADGLNVFVAEVSSENDVSSKFVKDTELDDGNFVSDFDLKVDFFGYVYAMVTGVSDTNVGSGILDPIPLSLRNNILVDEA